MSSGHFDPVENFPFADVVLRTQVMNFIPARSLMLAFLSFTFGSSAQITTGPNYSARNRGVDMTTHKFRPVASPVASPDMITLDAAGMSVKGDAVISPSATEQIDALLRDKQARTAAQRKISRN